MKQMRRTQVCFSGGSFKADLNQQGIGLNRKERLPKTSSSEAPWLRFPRKVALIWAIFLPN
jgi:hypothetical protein